MGCRVWVNTGPTPLAEAGVAFQGPWNRCLWRGVEGLSLCSKLTMLVSGAKSVLSSLAARPQPSLRTTLFLQLNTGCQVALPMVARRPDELVQGLLALPGLRTYIGP